jgi:hypothetical protein
MSSGHGGGDGVSQLASESEREHDLAFWDYEAGLSSRW